MIDLSPVQKAFEKLYKTGFEPRESQQKMAELAYTAFKKKQIAVIEGSTGIGKTFAYLIAGLLALKPKQQLIIATATITLQSQLFTKDLPKILEALDLNTEIKTILSKGRRRYACPQKLFHYGESEQFELNLMGIDPDQNQNNKSNKNTQNSKHSQLPQLQKAFKLNGKPGGWDGDLDNYTKPIADFLKPHITTDSAGCGQQKCGYFQICPYFKMRRKQFHSQIIVTNHHLLLADIDLGTGQLLPDPEKNLYIIDEAHHFPETAVNYFQGFIHFSPTLKWLNNLTQSLSNLPSYLNHTPDCHNLALDSAENLIQLLQTLLEHESEFQPIDDYDTRLKPLSQTVLKLFNESKNFSKILTSQLIQLRKSCLQDSLLQTNEHFAKIIDSVGAFADRAQNIYKSFHLLSYPENTDQPPVAKWIEKSDDLGFSLHAAMTSSSNFLPNLFWDKIQNGLILCSATLRALNQFDYFLKKTGLDYLPQNQISTAAFKSDFDYSKSTLTIPQMKHSPGGAQLSSDYVDELSDLIESIIEKHLEKYSEKNLEKNLESNLTGYGILVLFTSKKLLDRVYDNLKTSTFKFILAQPDYPQSDLLSKHKKRIDQKKLSVIFGLQSFAEGVDLPGNYCKQVIIPRLPFAVPTTPVERTWVSWLESQGQNPFMTHTLPKTAIQLTQYVGRLIRRQSDSGEIILCDQRVIQKRYGKILLDSLPNFKKITQ